MKEGGTLEKERRKVLLYLKEYLGGFKDSETDF